MKSKITYFILIACYSLLSVGNSGAQNIIDAADGDTAKAITIERIARRSMVKYNLRAMIVRVTIDGREIYTGALGESMTGVPASPEMHYRNGAFAFTYIGEIMAQLVDRKMVSLDDRLSTWMRELPNSDRVTVKMLLNMTSGYADYVYQTAVLDGTSRDPFRQWTSEELIQIAMSQPMDFEPGTNWGYSHTNYVVLGRVIEKITGKPMATVMEDYIVDPMGLVNTSSNDNTPAIEEPVLHTFSSERREFLQIPPAIRFYEESTFWNPSWTTAEGAVQTTDITDMTTSMEIVGSGKLVSPEMYRAQVGKNLVGFGSKDPTGRCRVCRSLDDERSYGLGVVLLGDWITQTKNFAGSGASSGYLPSKKLTISVVTTYAQPAFDAAGEYKNASITIFGALAAALAGDETPPAFSR